MEAEYRSIYEKFRTFEAQVQRFSNKLNTNHSPTLQEIEAYKIELRSHFEENLVLLQKMAKYSRSSHAKTLARMQLEYIRKTEDFFTHLEDDEDDEDEVHLLHSEFSIDLAHQSIIFALMSSLHSIEKTERKKLNERN